MVRSFWYFTIGAIVAAEVIMITDADIPFLEMADDALLRRCRLGGNLKIPDKRAFFVQVRSQKLPVYRACGRVMKMAINRTQCHNKLIDSEIQQRFKPVFLFSLND